MGKFIDMSGNKYGRLTCLERSGTINGHVAWIFDCDCGKKGLRLRGVDVRNKNTNSCGCQRNENTAKANKERARKIKEQK